MPIDRPPTPPRPKGDQVSLVDSFRRLAAWLKEHDAVGLMKSLSPGAKPTQLVKLEQKLGFAVPPGLRALWLMHDGQRRADDCIIGTLQLLPVAWVLNVRPAILALVKSVASDPAELKKSGLTEAEAQSEKWLPVASKGKDCVIVNCTTGRVFAGESTASSLRLLASSVPQWLETYANDVERERYGLVIGPDGSFMELVRED